jgi:hypothetical protein
MKTMLKKSAFTFILMFIASTPYASAQQSIGAVSTVKKQVHVTHPGQDQVLLVKSGDGVIFQDTYETEAEARAKLLFQDDSLLTLGEKTRLQITENVYNPAQDQRSAVMKLLSGRVRVLVGKVFTGAGSKFEIHTPTAVAASRGTYYIVWLFMQDGKLATGIAVLEGTVEAGNIDGTISGTVQLGPNQYTIVTDTAPPTTADSIHPDLLADLLSSTELPDELKDLAPPDLVQTPDDLFSLTMFADIEDGLPGLPPILQQPSLGTTPVLVEIQFP